MAAIPTPSPSDGPASPRKSGSASIRSPRIAASAAETKPRSVSGSATAFRIRETSDAYGTPSRCGAGRSPRWHARLEPRHPPDLGPALGWPSGSMRQIYSSAGRPRSSRTNRSIERCRNTTIADSVRHIARTGWSLHPRPRRAPRSAMSGYPSSTKVSRRTSGRRSTAPRKTADSTRSPWRFLREAAVSV